MDLLASIGAVGDVLSTVCLAVGVPSFLMGRWLHDRQRDLEPCEIVVIDRGGRPAARWYVRGDFHERRLRRAEIATLDGATSASAFVSARRPDRMRLDDDVTLERTCTVVGVVLLAAAALGIAASALPIVLG